MDNQVQKSSRLQQSYVVEKTVAGGSLEGRFNEEFQNRDANTVSVKRSYGGGQFVTENVGGAQYTTENVGGARIITESVGGGRIVSENVGGARFVSQSQEILRPSIAMTNTEVRKSYIVTPIENQNLVQSVQHVQMPVQFQTVQVPVQYMQVAVPVQSSQIIQVPQEQKVIKEVIVERDDAQVKLLMEENKKLRITLEDWRAKLLEFERRGPQVVEKIIEKPVEIVKVDDRRIRELEFELSQLRDEKGHHERAKKSAMQDKAFYEKRITELEEDLRRSKLQIEEWRSKVTFLESQGPRIVEKRVEVPVEIVKVDDRRIRELEEELRRSRLSIEEWRSKVTFFESQGPRIVEKRVEVPVEIVKVDDRRIRELEEELRKSRMSIEEWRSKVTFLEMQGPKIVEKRVEVPVEIVKKEVVVDDRRIRELESELNFFREESRKLKISIEEWRSKVTTLEMQGPRVVEKRVEVPIEVVKYVDKIIEKPFEVVKEKVIVDDRRIRELEFQINSLLEENKRLKINIEEWRIKIVEFEETRNQHERAKRSAHQDKAYYESEIVRLKKQIEELLSRGPQIVEKIVEKRVEVPFEVVKKEVVVDDRRIRELESELNFFREESRKLKISIEEWRSKVTMLEMQGPKIVEKRIEVPVEVVKKEVVVDDRRIRELESELNFFREESRKLKISIEEWRSKVTRLEMQGPKVIEKRVEVPIEVVKYVDKIIEKPFEVVKEKVIVDDRRIRELEFQINSLLEENKRLKINIEEWRIKIVEFEETRNQHERAKRSAHQDKAYYESEIVRLKKQIEELLSRGPQIVEKIVEKRVEVPFEVVKKEVVVDDRRIRELESELNFFREESRKLKISIEEWRSKVTMLEMQGPRIVEKRIEVPVEVVKKEVVVDDRRIRELESELSFFREESRKLKISIEEWRSKVTTLEMQGPRVVEKRVEVPVEVVKYVDKIIERPFEVVKEKVIVDDRRIRELEFQINSLLEENKRLKVNIEEWRIKIVEFEESKNQHERAKRSAHQDKAYYESEIVRLKKQIEELHSRGPQIVEKIVEKRVEVPFEVVKKEVVVDDRRIRELESELNFFREESRKLKISIEEWRSKVTTLEMQGPRIVEKRIEVPVEVVKKEVVVDDRRIRELESELNFFREESRKLKISIEEWRSKVTTLEMQGPRIVEKRVEVPVEVVKYVDKIVERPFEVVKEKVIVDDRRIRELEFQINSLLEENKRLKVNIEEWRIKIVEFEETRNQHERAKKSAHQDKAYYESEIVRLKKQIEELYARGPQIVEKIVEKRVEVPFEVIKKEIVVDDSKVKSLSYEIERLNRTIEEWRSRYSTLEVQITEFRGVDIKVRDYESKIALLSSEIERLNSFVRKLREENETLNVRIVEFRSSETKIVEYENRVTMMASEIERLNSFIRKLKEENESLSIKIVEFRSSETKIVEYENRVTMMASEIERLNSFIRKLKEDNDGLNIKIVEFRSYETRIQEYENRVAMMASEIERLNGFIRKLREENEGYLIKIHEYDDQRQHHERVKQSSVQDKNFLENKITMLTTEIERLNSVIVEFRSKESRLIDYENKVAMLSTENSRLNSMIKMKVEELESWREKYVRIESSMSQYRDSDSKIKILGEEIDRLNQLTSQQRKELEEWRFKYVEYSSLTTKIQEHYLLFVALFAEIESLRGRIVQKDQEVEEMRRSGLGQIAMQVTTTSSTSYR